MNLPSRFDARGLTGLLRDRRRFLGQALRAGAAGLGAGRVIAWAAPCRPSRAGDDHEPERRVLSRAREAGLGELTTHDGGLYRAIGNAPERFQKTAIGLCEALATDFLDHFESRKFALHKPERKMLLVVLANPADFAAFVDLKQEAGPVRGIYEVAAGWLVICDNRDDASPRAERANSVALFHEATHQLTYETGLLSPPANLPLAIVEGLGTYGEVRRPDARARIGAVNTERVAVLAAAARNGLSLIPLNDLFAHDDLFDAPDSEQLAYAQSWALVHLLMQPPWVARFQAYLKLANSRREARAPRLADATEALGPLATLQADLKKSVNRLLRRAT